LIVGGLKDVGYFVPAILIPSIYIRFPQSILRAKSGITDHTRKAI